MTYTCEWCGDQMDRAWEIPRSRDRDKQWVCKECHTGYFDGDLNDDGTRQRKIT